MSIIKMARLKTYPIWPMLFEICHINYFTFVNKFFYELHKAILKLSSSRNDYVKI